MMSNQRKSAAATFKALFPVAVAALCAFTLSDCNSEKETLQDSEMVKTTNDDGQETVNTTLKKSGQSNDNVFMVVEQMPEFPGGEAEMRKFIAENVQYPEDAKLSGASGTAYIKFVVDKNGKVTLPDVIKSSGTESIDNEALRVIKLLPDFKPGMQRSQVVDVQLTVPIKFSMK